MAGLVHCPDRAEQAAFSVAELTFGFVDRHDQIVALAPHEWFGQSRHAFAVLGDMVGDGRQLRRG